MGFLGFLGYWVDKLLVMTHLVPHWVIGLLGYWVRWVIGFFGFVGFVGFVGFFGLFWKISSNSLENSIFLKKLRWNAIFYDFSTFGWDIFVVFRVFRQFENWLICETKVIIIHHFLRKNQKKPEKLRLIWETKVIIIHHFLSRDTLERICLL